MTDTPEEAYAKLSFVGGADRQDVLDALREQREAGRREGEEKMEKVRDHLVATFNEGGDVDFLENQICTAIAMLDPDAVLATEDQEESPVMQTLRDCPECIYEEGEHPAAIVPCEEHWDAVDAAARDDQGADDADV